MEILLSNPFDVSLDILVKGDLKERKHNVRTYREIVAFIEGRTLDEPEQSCERGKRGYQNLIFAISAGIITAIVTAFFRWLLL